MRDYGQKEIELGFGIISPISKRSSLKTVFEKLSDFGGFS